MAKPGLAVLLLSYLAFVSLGLPDTVLGVAWPSLQVNFGVAPSAMGAVLASAMGGYFFSGLYAGVAVTRFGVGGVLTLSSALVTVALFGYALAPSWTVFFPFGAVWGLGSGAIDAGLNGYAARHFSVRHVNWLHACWGIGASVGPAVMTLTIATGYGYSSGYAILGATLGTMALLFLVTRSRWNDTERATAFAPRSNQERQGLLVALRNARVRLQVLFFLLYTGLEATVGQWCFSWLRDQRGFGIETAGAWTSAYWASLTAGRIVLGGIVDRVGPDRMVRYATFGAALGVAIFVCADGVPGCLGLLLVGSSLAPMFPTLMARTPARVGNALAHHAVGLQVSAATLGAALGPSVLGFCVARQGLGAFGAVVVVIALALLTAHERLLAAHSASAARSTRFSSR